MKAHDWIEERRLMREQIAELERQRDALLKSAAMDGETITSLAKANDQLVAENLALKSGIGEAYDEMEQLDEGHFSTDEDGQPMDTLIPLVNAQAVIHDFAIEIETPTTDAALRELMAQGCDKYADATEQIGKEENDEDIIYAGKQARLFAQQLREGKV